MHVALETFNMVNSTKNYIFIHLYTLHQCRIKPIFHCNAKYLASGVGVGQCPRHQNFALEMPTQNVKFALPLTPTRDASQWNIGGVGSPNARFSLWPCTFHVVYASGTQSKLVFQWNMGLRVFLFGKLRKIIVEKGEFKGTKIYDSQCCESGELSPDCLKVIFFTSLPPFVAFQVQQGILVFYSS